MRWLPKIKDRVENVDTREAGEVTEVNEWWGWYEVLWDSGRYRRYSMTNSQTVRLIKSAAEIKADRRLREESLGLTDDWREYDA